MPLPVLTWNQAVDTLIAVTDPTYAEFLNDIDAMVTASTHWRVNAKNLDVGNNRGWIELAPKSSLPGVTEGRVLVLYSTGTVAGTAGTEVPRMACRNAPWALANTSLVARMWIGFSPDANSSASGPVNDPWTNATPYGAGPLWSRLFPMNAGDPPANALMGLIESAEGICVHWTATNYQQINGFISGRLVESVDGETGMWSVHVLHTNGDTSSVTSNPWISVVGAIDSAPLGHASGQHSAGATGRSLAACFDAGVLKGFGRTQFATQSASDVSAGMSNLTTALFQAIILGGGPYGGGSNDQLLGLYRQVRWGPAAYRGQILTSGGVAQGINLNYANATTGAKPWGLWFDNFR